MKNLLHIGMCALLVGFGVERTMNGRMLFAAKEEKAPAQRQPAAAAKSGKKTTAKQALAGAKKAFAAMTKAARADKELDSKTPKNKPFWKAAHNLAKQLDRAEKGLAAKNDDFFKGVSDARAMEQQLKVDWQLTGSENKQVITNAKKLGRALAILRTDFSKEAARKKKGGELTDKEKQEFAKIKEQQKGLLAKVKALEAKASKDKPLEHGLNEIAEKANKITGAPDTLDSFIATLYLLDEIEGLLYGYDYYIDPVWRADWIDVALFTTEWEAIYSDILVLEVYDWAAADISVDLLVTDDYGVSESLSDQEIEAQGDWAEGETFDMPEAEQGQVAEAEDSDPEVEADDSDDDDSMEDASDDDGVDFDGDGDDDGDSGSDDDGGGGDDDEGGGDDGGDDDGGGDDGE